MRWFLASAGLSLLLIFVSHGRLVVGLVVRRGARGLWALVNPVAVPYWGWRFGMQGWVLLWGGALVVYAVSVAALRI